MQTHTRNYGQNDQSLNLLQCSLRSPLRRKALNIFKQHMCRTCKHYHVHPANFSDVVEST